MNYVAEGRVVGVRHSIAPNAKRRITVEWSQNEPEQDRYGIYHSIEIVDENGVFSIDDRVEIRITKLSTQS